MGIVYYMECKCFIDIIANIYDPINYFLENERRKGKIKIKINPLNFKEEHGKTNQI